MSTLVKSRQLPASLEEFGSILNKLQIALNERIAMF